MIYFSRVKVSMLKTTIFNKWLLALVLLISFILRFYNLGYSNFYGDETKTFYLDKTVTSREFFLNQRKGPVQFLVVWGVEKIIGGNDEFWTRLPFAVAGFGATIAFYFLVKELFNNRIALVSTSLFSLNGFYIAFARTIQYQSFLLLFGLLSILYALYYLKSIENSRIFYAVASAIFLGLAYLSHFDAVFFGVAVGFIFIQKLIKNKAVWKEILLYHVTPFFLIIGLFYVPYIVGGYFDTHTSDYLGRRLLGNSFAQNLSWYTFWIYNPTILWGFLMSFMFVYFFKQARWKRHLVMVWFLTGFIALEFIFSNPGTHILNYFLPLTILVSIEIIDIYDWISNRNFTNFIKIYVFGLVLIFSCLFVIDVRTFLVDGYPWDSNQVSKKYHLFLYGFAYNRGWDQIRSYFSTQNGVKGVWTNDNDTIAEYYLRGIDYTPPGSNFIPQYYVHVYNNQEFVYLTQKFEDEFLVNYNLQREFFVNERLTSAVYRHK